ncbi:MAG: T9SS type A sorting domain-containing protein [Ignavibacteria bacterium]|nr:T9SS type A sorting domain-containing protein [Ignavibacteria bacterium]
MKTLFLLLFIYFFNPLLLSQTSSYNFSSSSGTYTEITGGIVLGTVNNDDEVFNNNTTGEAAPQTDIGFPIGFNFNYNGVLYTNFAVNTNGWIKLGNGSFTIGNTYTPLSISTAAGYENILSPLGRDLQGQAGSELSYLLTGSSPNRILVIQWKNYRRFNIASGESFNFQIRLSENNFLIQYVYGTVTTTNTSTSTANNPTQLGIRGLVNTDFKNRTSTSNWASSSPGSLNTNTIRLTTSVKPASGLTYTFTPASMSYSSSTTLIADTSTVKKGSQNNPVIKILVVVTGTLNSLTITSITCKTNGTTNTSDITSARMWYTGNISEFSAVNQFGSVIVNPDGTINFNDTKQLASGTNYFWLTYDINSNAQTGNYVDGECSAITVGSARTPTIQAPSGSRRIANNPLTGTYSVGLSLFNLVTGKNLYYQKIEKQVKLKEFSKKQITDYKRSGKADQFYIYNDLAENDYISKNDTFILMDGETQYSEPGFIEITNAMRNKFGRSLIGDEVNGIYSSITSAVNDLGSRGVQGPVIFSLVDAIYSTETFPITINGIYGTGIVNTVTFKPAAGVNTQILMASGNAVFKIINSAYITIDGSNTINGTSRNLSIISNYSNVSNCIWIGSSGINPVNNIKVKNCNIKAGETSLGSTPVIVSDGSVAGNPGYFNNIIIQNNFIQKGRQGIYVNGGIIPQNGSDISIIDNVINSTGADATGFMGIYVQGIINAEISGNEIANLNNTAAEDDKAIWIANGSHSITAERNRIYNIGYTGTSGQGGHGIYISSSHINADVTIKNNLIYNIYGDGWNHNDSAYFLDNPAGIMLYSSTPQSGINIYNNSINLYGNTLIKSSSMSSGIFLTSGTAVDLRNNSIVNNLGTLTDSAYGSCAVFAQSSALQFSNIDYNNYYVNPSGNGVKAIGKISGNSSLSLSNWIIATGKDKSSLNFNPGYTSNVNLLPDITQSDCWTLNGRGVQIAAVNNDFSQNIRSTALATGAPDIGAYEFTPVSEPNLMLQSGVIAEGSSTLFLFGNDTAAVITWHNSGAGLPTSVSARYYSGTNPPSVISGNYGNSYLTFSAAGGSGYTFDIKLYYDPALIGTISGEDKISMASYFNSNWVHYDAEVNNTFRTVYKTGLSDLSLFALDDFDDPLPVLLESFNYSASGRNVKLIWKTTMEINNAGFDVERKSEFDNKWNKIAFVEGNGNSNSGKNYEYFDNNLNTAKYNYRLKQINFNGSYEYYDLNHDVVIGKPVNYDISQNYPNPSNPSSKINFQVPVDYKVTIKVYDIQGREVKTIIDNFLTAGYYTASFDGSNIASGIYFYRLNSGAYSKTLKLILVK